MRGVIPPLPYTSYVQRQFYFTCYLSGLFSARFPTKILYAFRISLIRAATPPPPPTHGGQLQTDLSNPMEAPPKRVHGVVFS